MSTLSLVRDTKSWGLLSFLENIGEPDVGVIAAEMFVAEKGRRMYRQGVCGGSVMVCLLGKSAAESVEWRSIRF
jgi:hypothetical protein